MTTELHNLQKKGLSGTVPQKQTNAVMEEHDSWNINKRKV